MKSWSLVYIYYILNEWLSGSFQSGSLSSQLSFFFANQNVWVCVFSFLSMSHCLPYPVHVRKQSVRQCPREEKLHIQGHHFCDKYCLTLMSLERLFRVSLGWVVFPYKNQMMTDKAGPGERWPGMKDHLADTDWSLEKGGFWISRNDWSGLHIKHRRTTTKVIMFINMI